MFVIDWFLQGVLKTCKIAEYLSCENFWIPWMKFLGSKIKIIHNFRLTQKNLVQNLSKLRNYWCMNLQILQLKIALTKSDELFGAKFKLIRALCIIVHWFMGCDCLWSHFWNSEGLRLKWKFHIVLDYYLVFL